MTARNPTLGVGLVVLAATCFIVNGCVSRVPMRAGVDPALLTTLRITGTFVMLLLVALAFRRSALRPPRGRILLLILGHGLVGVVALQWTYFVAIDRLPVGMALLLEYQAPILVALWARFVRRQAVRPRLWLGLVLAIAGLAAATGVWEGAGFDSIGVLAGFGAAVSYAGYFLLGETGVAALDPLRMILWSFGFATVAINLAQPLTDFGTGRLTDRVSLLGRLDDVHVPLWTALAWIVLMGTVVPFFAGLLALSHIQATTATAVAMLEPIGVSALAWAWFDESLGVIAVIGCFVVVAGILLAQSARPAVAEPPLVT